MANSHRKWQSIGGSVPLFDRLVDLNPEVTEEIHPLSMYHKKQLIDSVIREASHLLNTRCTIPYKEYESLDPSSLVYGMPKLYGLFDGSYNDPSRTLDTLKLARVIANALRIFDPRLESVNVIIDKYDQSDQKVYLTISANLKIGMMVESISFPIEMAQE